MGLELRANLRQTLRQDLRMTAQLQQAIKLLQMGRIELEDAVRQELEENPLLEEVLDTTRLEAVSERSVAATDAGNAVSDVFTIDHDAGAASAESPYSSPTALDRGPESLGETLDAEAAADQRPLAENVSWDDYRDDYQFATAPGTGTFADGEEMPGVDQTLESGTTLYDHLMWQAQLAPELDDLDRAIAKELIGNLGDNGYLEDIGVISALAAQFNLPEHRIDRVRALIQRFDPVGICSLDLRDCLKIQAELRNCSHACRAIIENHLENIAKRQLTVVTRALNITNDELLDAIRELQTLEPRPARNFVTLGENPTVVPDAFVFKVGDNWHIELNEAGLPRLRVTAGYRDELKNGVKGQTREYLKERKRSAEWFIKSLDQRQRTIYRVVESILKFQPDFFDKGKAHLRPLVLREVADDLELHESTISRVTSNKYVETPHGIFELKYFFNSAITRDGAEDIASESVKELLREIISGEDPKRPLSDQKLVELLAKRDITIARRTVAKYREMLGIASSSDRKRIV